MPTITICGSTKYKEEILKIAAFVTLKGVVVLCPMVFSHHDNIELTDEELCTLKKIHRQKIDMSDAVLIIKNNDHIGDNTKEELEYAKSKDKMILYCDITDIKSFE